MSSVQTAINERIAGMAPSATLAINEQSRMLAAQGKEIFKLGFGQSPFPVPKRVRKALAKNAFQKDYLPVKGLMALREAVASFNVRRIGVASQPTDIMIGPGSKELMFLLQLVYDADLLLPRPGWVSYAPQAQIIGRPVHWLETQAENDWRLTAEELDRFCASSNRRSGLLVLNYPSNPLGTTYSSLALADIAAVAKRYGLLVLSDEIYGELHFSGEHRSIASHYPEGTIVSSGLSKWCGAGGWRLGTFSFPAELNWLLEAMAVAASETFTTTSAPVQYAAVEAFKGGDDIDVYLHQSRQVLQLIGEAVSDRLSAAMIPHPRPVGGFYLFPDFSNYRAALAKRGISTSAELCQALLAEKGVALLPASDFGFSPDHLAARLSYVDFDGTEALRKIDQLDAPSFVQTIGAHLLEGIEGMTSFLQGQ